MSKNHSAVVYCQICFSAVLFVPLSILGCYLDCVTKTLACEMCNQLAVSDYMLQHAIKKQKLDLKDDFN